MGNSSSVSNNNNPHLNEIKNILEADTETYNRTGGDKNVSETSEEKMYTESNANKPFYNEYMDLKKKYLESKMNKNLTGGNYKLSSNLRQIILDNY
jgi:phage-related protein